MPVSLAWSFASGYSAWARPAHHVASFQSAPRPRDAGRQFGPLPGAGEQAPIPTRACSKVWVLVGLTATWLQLADGREEQRRTAASAATQQALTQDQQRRTAESVATQLALTREGQITDRFTNAIERFGSEIVAEQLGGIYALEGIAFNSPEDYHDPEMQALPRSCGRSPRCAGQGLT